MLRRIQLMMLCSVLCWLCAGTAQAGFVSPDFLDGEMGSSAAREVNPGSEQNAPEQAESDSSLEAILGFANSSTSSPTGGMSGNGGTSTYYGASGLVTTVVPELEPQLISTYLVREADSVLPDAFLERVFRPPRSNAAVAG